MKVSELLALHPELDTELNEHEDDLFLDAVYLFRVIRSTDEPGESVTQTASSDHTDGVVRRGLVTCAAEINASGWTRD